MSLENLPQDILDLYDVHEYRHAVAILQADFPNEYNDIINMLTAFKGDFYKLNP